MAKKKLHPKWYSTKIYCEGILILEVGGTKEKINVEIWLENRNSSKILNKTNITEDYNYYIL
jgi:hypothetical protein